jgi:hypothetical protein
MQPGSKDTRTAGFFPKPSSTSQVNMALDCYRHLLDLFPQLRWAKDRDFGEAGAPQNRRQRKPVYEAIGVVDVISVTGSTTIGKRIMEKGAAISKRQMERVESKAINWRV